MWLYQKDQQFFMRVVVDESGDVGFKFAQNSSRFFVMSLVVFSTDDQAELVSKRIDTLRKELRLPNVEFHFSKNKDTIRRAFLSAVQGYDFTAFVVAVDKTKLNPSDYKDQNAFYQSVSGIAFDRAKESLGKAKVVFDETGGRNFKKTLASYLKRKINTSEREYISQVETAASTNNNLLQLADYACGVVARTYEEGDAKYQEHLRQRLIVTQWPE